VEAKERPEVLLAGACNARPVRGGGPVLRTSAADDKLNHDTILKKVRKRRRGKETEVKGLDRISLLVSGRENQER